VQKPRWRLPEHFRFGDLETGAPGRTAAPGVSFLCRSGFIDGIPAGESGRNCGGKPGLGIWEYGLLILKEQLQCGAQINMNETKPQWEPSGLERFGQLEDKIFRMVEEFKAVRKEIETLRAENEQLKEQIGSLRNNESSVQDNLAQFQKEREELRERVEKALALLATLEAR
jgi:FtsZ-binding cell division protein ZapB